MKINSINSYNSQINFSANKLVPTDEIILKKIRYIKRFKNKDSGMRKVMVSSILEFFKKDISYLAYKNSNIDNYYSEIVGTITKKIVDIIDSKSSSSESLKEIKNILKYDNKIESERNVLSDPDKNASLNIDLLSQSQKKLINQVSNSSIKNVAEQNNKSIYKTKVSVDAAVYKSQRRSGVIPDNIVDFVENYKKVMNIKNNDNNKIYKMIESRYDILNYKNRLNILKERADFLYEKYKEYNITRDEWNNIFYNQPELIFYSSEYVTAKIESNAAEFEKENISKQKFMSLVKTNTDLLSMKKETIIQKFENFKSMLEKYNINYSNFSKMLEKFPEIFQRDPEKIFLRIDDLEKLLNTKAFDREKYINAIIKHPVLLSTSPEKFVDHINKTSESLIEYDVTKDDYIRACLNSPTILNLTDKKIVYKINEMDKIFSEENFDKRKFVRAAVRKPTVFAYSPEKMKSNIDDFVKIYENYGLTRKRYLDCALKVPALFTRNPESISKNINTIVDAFSNLGLTTQIFIDNIDSNANILSLDPYKVIEKIKVYYQTISENYKSENLSAKELWNKVLRKNLTYSLDRVFISRLNYKMLSEKPFGKNDEPKIIEIIKENPDKIYKIKLSDTDIDHKFAEYIKSLSEQNTGKNIFDIEFEKQ